MRVLILRSNNERCPISFLQRFVERSKALILTAGKKLMADRPRRLTSFPVGNLLFAVFWVRSHLGLIPQRLKLFYNCRDTWGIREKRSEEHTSELQSQSNLVCRLL